MGAPGAGAPPMFSDSYIARLNFIHTDHTALAYRSVEPPFTKPSSYAPVQGGQHAELKVQDDQEVPLNIILMSCHGSYCSRV